MPPGDEEATDAPLPPSASVVRGATPWWSSSRFPSLLLDTPRTPPVGVLRYGGRDRSDHRLQTRVELRHHIAAPVEGKGTTTTQGERHDRQAEPHVKSAHDQPGRGRRDHRLPPAHHPPAHRRGP